MKRFLAAAALLLGAPLRAAIVAAPIESAPVLPSAAVLLAPAVSAAPALTASPAVALAPAAAPAALTAPSLIPAAAAPVPAAAAASAAPAPAAAPSHSAPALRDGSSEGSLSAASLFFDRASAAPQTLDDFLNAHSARPLGGGVFIQQEHEGSLLAPDSRDSSGNIFRYYRPVELRPDLAAEVDKGLKGFSKLVYSVRRAVQIKDRGVPEGAWRAWPTSAKLDYLDRLEKAVTAEKGPQAAWDGKVSLIMERAPGAPDFVTRHPHMEAPPDGYRGAVGARFLQPEIVSAKDTPSASVHQALGRARQIIADTGHAGVQFHVFVKASPDVLLAQMDRLDGALQLVNDALFAKAATESERNIDHPSLRPWHRGRSERVRALLSDAGARLHVPEAEDPDSEKHAFVGLRYWGMEDDKAVVSFELRGASLPWKRPAGSVSRGVEDPKLPERDYSSARAYLTFLSVYAEALARGEAPSVAAPSVALDPAASEAVLRGRARVLGLPDSAYDGLAAMARRLTGASSVPQGYLFPFAASAADSEELNAFADQVVVLAARLKTAEDAGYERNERQDRYQFWSAYAAWAERYGARQDARLEALARASVRD